MEYGLAFHPFKVEETVRACLGLRFHTGISLKSCVKACGSCARDLDESCFSKRGSGLQSKCRECQKEYKRKHYVRNKEVYLAKAKAYDAKVKSFVDDLKGSSPCMDCGISYPAHVMDFDHRPGEVKLFEIADAVSSLGLSLKRILPEAAKCDIVCANCHRIRTYSRRYLP